MNNIKYIDIMYAIDSEIKQNNIRIDNIKNANERNKKFLEDILNKEDIKLFISQKLQESIDKFGLNDNKDDELYTVSTYTYSSSNNKTKTEEHKSINPNGKFDPFNDKWEILSIDKDKDNRYKISVENIKGRKFLNPFMWEPDIFNTDWFEINLE